jgi:hypothetical protein
LDVLFSAKRGDLPVVFSVGPKGTQGTYPETETPPEGDGQK